MKDQHEIDDTWHDKEDENEEWKRESKESKDEVRQELHSITKTRLERQNGRERHDSGLNRARPSGSTFACPRAALFATSTLPLADWETNHHVPPGVVLHQVYRVYTWVCPQHQLPARKAHESSSLANLLSHADLCFGRCLHKRSLCLVRLKVLHKLSICCLHDLRLLSNMHTNMHQ